MTNPSLLTADRSTHVKIAAVALVAALLVVAFGFRAHINVGSPLTTRAETTSTVVKAGKPVTSASSDGMSIR